MFYDFLTTKITSAFELYSRRQYWDMIYNVQHNVHQTSIPVGSGRGGKSTSLQVSLGSYS